MERPTNYTITQELLDEAISGLRVFGKEATGETVRKLEDLKLYQVISYRIKKAYAKLDADTVKEIFGEENPLDLS